MSGFDRQRLRRAEFYTVGVAVLFVAAMAVSGIVIGAGDVTARLGLLTAELIAGLLALSLLNYALRAWRWHLFGRRLDIAIPVGRTALVYVAGFAMTPTPGKMGEALRLWLLERIYGFRYARTAAVMIGDRLGDMVAILGLCLFGVGAFTGYGGSILLVAAGGAMLTVLLARPGLVLGLIGAAHRAIGRWTRLFAAARHSVRHTAKLFTPPVAIAALGLGTVGWLAECVGLFWLVNAMGATISLQGAVFVFAFSLLVGAVSMLPGGLGSTEATMFALLTLADVPADVALAATAVNRAATLWFAVLLGVAVLPAAMRLARGPAMATEEADSRA